MVSAATTRLDDPPDRRDFLFMTLAGFPRISIDPALCGGRPVVEGTRVRVSDVLEMLAGGTGEDEIIAAFPYLARADIRACLHFAAHATGHPLVAAA